MGDRDTTTSEIPGNHLDPENRDGIPDSSNDATAIGGRARDDQSADAICSPRKSPSKENIDVSSSSTTTGNPVEKICKKTSCIVKTFPSLTKAAEVVGLDYCKLRYLPMDSGTVEASSGFLWRYASKGNDESKSKESRVKEEKIREQDIAQCYQPKTGNKLVEKICNDSRQVVETFSTIQDAAAACAVNSVNMGKKLKLGLVDDGRGFLWRLKPSGDADSQEAMSVKKSLIGQPIISLVPRREASDQVDFPNSTDRKDVSPKKGRKSTAEIDCRRDTCEISIVIPHRNSRNHTFKSMSVTVADKVSAKEKCKPIQKSCKDKNAIIQKSTSAHDATSEAGLVHDTLGRKQQKGVSDGGAGFHCRHSPSGGATDRRDGINVEASIQEQDVTDCFKTSWNSKSVEKICKKTHKVVQTFPSLKRAAEENGLIYFRIHTKLSQGVVDDGAGFCWRYASNESGSDQTNEANVKANIQEQDVVDYFSTKKKARPVEKICKTTYRVVQKFPTFKKAVEESGLNYKRLINKSLQGIVDDGAGFYLRYASNDNSGGQANGTNVKASLEGQVIVDYVVTNTNKAGLKPTPVEKICKVTNAIVQTFTSTKEAAEESGFMYGTLRMKLSKGVFDDGAGFYWRYAPNESDANRPGGINAEASTQAAEYYSTKKKARPVEKICKKTYMIVQAFPTFKKAVEESGLNYKKLRIKLSQGIVDDGAGFYLRYASNDNSRGQANGTNVKASLEGQVIVDYFMINTTGLKPAKVACVLRTTRMPTSAAGNNHGTSLSELPNAGVGVGGGSGFYWHNSLDNEMKSFRDASGDSREEGVLAHCDETHDVQDGRDASREKLVETAAYAIEDAELTAPSIDNGCATSASVQKGSSKRPIPVKSLDAESADMALDHDDFLHPKRRRLCDVWDLGNFNFLSDEHGSIFD